MSLPPLAAPFSYAAVARTAVPSAVPAVPPPTARTAHVTSAHLDTARLHAARLHAARLHAAATAGARSGIASLSLPAAFAAHRRQADALSLARSLCAGAVRAPSSALSAPALALPASPSAPPLAQASPSAPQRVLRSATSAASSAASAPPLSRQALRATPSAQFCVIAQPHHLHGAAWLPPLHMLHPDTKSGADLRFFLIDHGCNRARPAPAITMRRRGHHDIRPSHRTLSTRTMTHI